MKFIKKTWGPRMGLGLYKSQTWAGQGPWMDCPRPNNGLMGTYCEANASICPPTCRSTKHKSFLNLSRSHPHKLHNNVKF